MTRRTVLAAATAALAVVCAQRASWANGAFPAVSQLVVEPGDAKHLVLRSNFGLVSSHDGGLSWTWACEQGLGYANIEPPIAVLAGGATILGLPNGIAVGDPAGCDYKLAAGLSANVTDVSAELARSGAALAVSVNWDDVTSQLWESLDEGAHFEPLGAPIPHFSALTIDAAHSDGERIYVSGMDWEGELHGSLLVSNDHGKSWQPYPIAGTDAASQPYIAALDPKHEDTVYVRLTGLPGKLQVTKDAGESFVEALSIGSPIQGFAVSPDGRTLVASSVNDGIFRASADTLEFERVACEGLSCLSWSGAGLLGCGTQAQNGFGLGRSADEGRSFDVLLDLLCLSGPAACDAQSSTGAVCGGVWPTVSQNLGQDLASCTPGSVSTPFSSACFQETSSGGAGGDGDGAAGGGGSVKNGQGSAPAGGAPASMNQAGASGSVAGAEDSAPALSSSEESASRGCSCSIGTEAQPASWSWLGLVMCVCLRRVARATSFRPARSRRSKLRPARLAVAPPWAAS